MSQRIQYCEDSQINSLQSGYQPTTSPQPSVMGLGIGNMGKLTYTKFKIIKYKQQN